MKVVYGIRQAKKYRKPVVALGVFDGVHRGHREILEETVRKARRIKGTSVVLTFWPHPQRQESLYSLEHRLRLIAELGIDACIVINFTKNFSEVPAEDFVRDILVKGLGAHYIYVGENFRFGRNIEGDSKALGRLSQEYNFKLELFPVVKAGDTPVSSTYIRSLIKQGNLGAAKKLLSRPVGIFGTVIRGSFLARRLGFPTANINPHHEVIPPPGIYAVKIRLSGKQYNGACYIGTNPTLQVKGPPHVEVHIFNFRQNIYGKDLEVLFIKKIRDEKEFSSVSALIKQIRKDLTLIKSLFSRH